MFDFVALFLVIAISVQGIQGGMEIPPDLQEFINEVHGICVKEIGISDDDVKNYQLSNTDTKMKCYMACLMKNSKWMSADGKIQFDWIRNNAHDAIKEVLLTAVNKCSNVAAGSDDCETAYNMNECLQKADPVHWFLP